MTRAAVTEFLQCLEPIQDRGDLTEDLRDLTATVTVDALGRSETGAILACVLNQPDIVTDCSVDIDGAGRSEPLFRITGRGVRLQREGFDQLADQTAVRGARYYADLSKHNNAGREGELLFGLVGLLHEVAATTTYTVDCSILIDKTAIVDGWMAATDDWAIDPDRVQGQFWYEIENLAAWLAAQPLDAYAAEMFDPDELPLLVYYRNGTDTALTGTDCFPVAALAESPEIRAEQFETYQRTMTVTKNNTSFFHEAPILSPALFAEAAALRDLFREAFLYAVFAVFADRVAQSDGTFTFAATYGPNALDEEPVDIAAQAAALSPDQRAALADVYREIARREDRDKFVEFWRRSMLQNCTVIAEVVDNVDAIRQSYRFMEEEVVEKNFDELSDAVRDTNVFMTEITSQVADTTAALSDEIQRLVFALLGAIIANLFLILRWSNFDTVIPFSLFVISAILVFYFPLIDRRVGELEEMKDKGQKDYDTYKELIAGFTGQAFDFRDLEQRKEDYITYADQRLAWAKRKVRQLHAFLLGTGFLFVVLANVWYPVASVQVGFAGVFALTSLYLSVQAYLDPDSYNYHRLPLPWRTAREQATGTDDADADRTTATASRNPVPVLVTIGSLIVLAVHIATGTF